MALRQERSRKLEFLYISVGCCLVGWLSCLQLHSQSTGAMPYVSQLDQSAIYTYCLHFCKEVAMHVPIRVETN